VTNLAILRQGSILMPVPRGPVLDFQRHFGGVPDVDGANAESWPAFIAAVDAGHSGFIPPGTFYAPEWVTAQGIPGVIMGAANGMSVVKPDSSVTNTWARIGFNGGKIDGVTFDLSNNRAPVGLMLLDLAARNVLGCEIVGSNGVPPVWSSSSVVLQGQVFRPTVDNGHYYVANGDGVTGVSEPAWTTTIGGLLGTASWPGALDGTVAWREGIHAAIGVANIDRCNTTVFTDTFSAHGGQVGLRLIERCQNSIMRGRLFNNSRHEMIFGCNQSIIGGLWVFGQQAEYDVGSPADTSTSILVYRVRPLVMFGWYNENNGPNARAMEIAGTANSRVEVLGVFSTGNVMTNKPPVLISAPNSAVVIRAGGFVNYASRMPIFEITGANSHGDAPNVQPPAPALGDVLDEKNWPGGFLEGQGPKPFDHSGTTGITPDWPFPPESAGAESTAIAGGTMYFTKVPVGFRSVISAIDVILTTPGVNLNAEQCFLSVFDDAGHLLGRTASQHTAWSGTPNLPKRGQIAFDAAGNAAGSVRLPMTEPFVWVGVQAAFSGGGSGPKFASANSRALGNPSLMNYNLAAGQWRNGTLAVAAGLPPVSITPSAMAASAEAIWTPVV
jgi:hypothetical protein